MDVFLARQPIFNISNEVYGYEILYRDGKENYYALDDGEYASSSVLTTCFIDFGIEEITNKKKAFINFTEELLLNNVAMIFPKQYLVVEILENVIANDEVIECCKTLKKNGYMLALDDFVFQPGYEELIKIVDIIKVDFTISSEQERRDIVKKYKRDGLAFLAEKVETQEDYKKAIQMGYTYFQGYYFSKPEIDSRRKVVPFKESNIKLIRYLNSNNKDFDKLTQIIENDLAFSFEILRLVNSAHFGLRNKITSIKQAVVTLGLDGLKKWLYLAVVRDLRQDKPDELINCCMLRAKFMENIAVKAGKKDLSSEMMTLGMFSMIDILMNKNMEEILEEMHFSEEIKMILLNKSTDGFIAESFQIVLKHEKGQWMEIESLLQKIGLSSSELNEAYLDAIKWIQKIK